MCSGTPVSDIVLQNKLACQENSQRWPHSLLFVYNSAEHVVARNYYRLDYQDDISHNYKYLGLYISHHKLLGTFIAANLNLRKKGNVDSTQKMQSVGYILDDKFSNTNTKQ